MKFGPEPAREAAGAVLAHSVTAQGRKFKKGQVLSAADAAALAEAGFDEVVVARLGPHDVPEDRAAARIAGAIAPEPGALGLSVSAPFTGRANLYAATGGVLSLDTDRVHALNALDEAVTLATLPAMARVSPRQMVATVKIIPYAAPEPAVAEAERLAGGAPLMHVHAPALASASLICTATPGMKQSVIDKGAEAVRARIAGLGLALADEVTVPHETPAIARAIAAAEGEMVLILTGSATSDRGDLGPSAVEAAGGRLIRVGMPVDPGNLLFLGELGARSVIGLPGCARSPKLNGADWVLERIACGLTVGDAEIAGMGVGGLLKEIPSRPAPRAGGGADDTARRPIVSAILLAAGASRRMGGSDKLMEPVDGEALIARQARRLGESGADETVVVLPPGDNARHAALAGTGARAVENARASEGMGTSIAAGVAAARTDADAVIILPADMPEIGAEAIDRLVAAYDPGEGRAIVRATADDGTPGHPVLFGRRFFEALRALEGDRGARGVIEEHAAFLTDVALPGRAALVDLDSPEEWEAWRGVATD